MTKKKTTPKNTEAPKEPTDVGQAVVLEADAAISEEDAYAYISLILAPDSVRAKMSEKRRREITTATMKFAALGFAMHEYLLSGKKPKEIRHD